MASANDVNVPTGRRLVGLDLLRFVALALVLGRHLEGCPADWPAAPRWVMATWLRGGWVGVDLFFVLSGFLVSGLLFAEYRGRGRLSLGRFYTRRGWKIYPAFFTMLGFTLLMNFAVFHRPLYVSRVLSEGFFLQSYVKGLWNHTWSLSVEEHFYLLLPLFLAGLLWRNRGSADPFRSIPAAAVVLGVALLAARVVNHVCRPTGFDGLTHLYPTHLRLDSLFFGVAIAYLFHFHHAAFVARLGPYRHALIVLGVLLLTPPFVVAVERSPAVYTAGLTLFSLASGMLLTGVLLCRAPAGRLALALAAVGTFSYSIYLWHIPMFAWGLPAIDRLLGSTQGFAARALFYLTGSVALGIAMAKLVEFPALRLRDRWFPAHARPSGDPSPSPPRYPGLIAVAGRDGPPQPASEPLPLG